MRVTTKCRLEFQGKRKITDYLPWRHFQLILAYLFALQSLEADQNVGPQHSRHEDRGADDEGTVSVIWFLFSPQTGKRKLQFENFYEILWLLFG